ncbi:acyltransferase family protein [Methylobacterium sp. Leaf118]|uniref:acyltransferase family protein n=1 Tax=Methylobacterium sp. Leaf118 TaxID=2876562 RepID=UPI001E46E584|nr:acyltransferase [Methylobacterium sp. Leaf118]
MPPAAAVHSEPAPSLWLSLQHLRAVAALLVVAYHMHHSLQKLGYDGGWPDWTQRGVDVFFVISGVVMWLTTRGRPIGPLAFYRRRILRIVPLYYILTTLVVLTLVAVPAAVQSGRFDGLHILGSYLFLPVQHPVLGTPVPALVPGWTLNCEMVFYAVFGLTLLLREGLRIPATLTVLALIVLAGAQAPADSAAAALYGSSIMLEFGLGLALGAFIGGGRSLPAPYAWASLGLGTLALALAVAPEAPRFLTAGLPACAIVGGALSLERRGRMPTLPPLLLLGDASYALYLSHGIVLSACTQFALRAGLGPSAGASLVFAVAGLCAVTVSAVALYQCVEQPLLRRMASARAG